MDNKQAAAVLRTMERDIRSVMDGVGEGGGWMTGATENYRPCLIPLQRGANALEMLEWLRRTQVIGDLWRTWLDDDLSRCEFLTFLEARFEESKKYGM